MDAVIDLVGGDLQARSFAVLRRGGRLVSAVSAPDQTRAAERGVVAGFFLVDVTTERLARIGAMIANSALRVALSAKCCRSARRASLTRCWKEAAHDRAARSCCVSRTDAFFVLRQLDIEE